MFYNKFNKTNIFIFLLLLILSITIFIYYVIKNCYISYYDELGYINISHGILGLGVLSIKEPLRTYLYPLIISVFTIFSNGSIVSVKIYMSLFQYSIYLFTILYLAYTSMKMIDNKVVWFTIVVMGFLNPYLIQATTLFLTDSLSTCLIILGFTYFINSSLKKGYDFFIILGFCFSAVMIRPSSLLFLPILYTLILFRYYKQKDFKFHNLIISSFLLLAVFFPQLYNNVKQFNHWTPLIHEDLYSFQSLVATHGIKYSTVVIPNEEPGLFYHGPVGSENTVNIYKLIYKNFLYFLLLYFGHIFGVIDWGYVDTYLSDYYPLSRIPSSILLYVSWFLIFVGIISLFQKMKYQDIFKKNKFKIYSLLASALIYTLFIGTTIVEARFGYPILLFLLPFSGLGMANIVDKYHESKSYRSILKYITFGITFIVVLLILSLLSDLLTLRINWFTKYFT